VARTLSRRGPHLQRELNRRANCLARRFIAAACRPKAPSSYAAASRVWKSVALLATLKGRVSTFHGPDVSRRGMRKLFDETRPALVLVQSRTIGQSSEQLPGATTMGPSRTMPMGTRGEIPKRISIFHRGRSRRADLLHVPDMLLSSLHASPLPTLNSRYTPPFTNTPPRLPPRSSFPYPPSPPPPLASDPLTTVLPKA